MSEELCGSPSPAMNWTFTWRHLICSAIVLELEREYGTVDSIRPQRQAVHRATSLRSAALNPQGPERDAPSCSAEACARAAQSGSTEPRREAPARAHSRQT